VLFLPIILKLRSQAKVTNLEVHIRVDEQVAKLQVPVYHTVAVKVLTRHDKVVHEEQRLRLVQTPAWPTTHVLIQCLVRAHLKDYENVISILKMVMEFHYVLMI